MTRKFVVSVVVVFVMLFLLGWASARHLARERLCQVA